MEDLEIHSKSYLVRWVSVSGNRTISWSIQPHKKSINLGIFKHPGSNAQNTNPQPASTFEPPPTPQVDAINPSSRRVSSSRNEASTAAEKLQSIGLILIQWVGRCEADKVSTGSYDVPTDQGGMYALVFDNTFSKQVSKTATLVLMTYLTNSPPETTHHLHHLQAGSTATISTSSLHGRQSPRISSIAADSTDSLHERGLANGTPATFPWHSPSSETQQDSKSPSFYTGILQKRRRKRHQGYARRFFSLDFTTGTLSYYHNQQSSALRGAIPLALAVVGANEKTREISVDSGAEVWHLRASTAKDFEAWRCALERASSSETNFSATASMVTARTTSLPPDGVYTMEEQEWARIEALVGRVSGIRDAVRRLATETGCPQLSDVSRMTAQFDSLDMSPTDMSGNDYFQDRAKRRFWKRKTSNGNAAPSLFHRSSSGRRSNLGAASSPLTADTPTQHRSHENGIHGHCMALLNDLDSVVTDFSQLITGSKRRRMTRVISHMSHRSVDSMSTAEFFDAEDGHNIDSQLVQIDNSEDEEGRDEFAEDDYDSASTSDAETAETFGRESPEENDHYTSLFSPRPKTLTPLPLGLVPRRSTIPPAMVQPPSLIGFLRKNVGKDLSTISMPVSANEPLSLLQRLSEELEYSSLLDKAARVELDSTERLLYITAFAISSLSNNRVKERAIRKPFNPMLGETFELVREDLGFRFIAEKVSHRPVRMACQAESQNWTYNHSPSPTQKFWGKSAELLTDGKARVILHSTGDCFTWTIATCFLRNILAGEKYVEPVGSMTIVNESNGQKAIATFKSKGMFSGRSEDVQVQTFSKTGEELSLSLSGKWTSHLSLTNQANTTTTIWEVGTLIDSAATHYGFTSFATTLNEITPIERSHLPPTDSRLRSDQRALERGDLDNAELLKGKLEEAQRARRREWEVQGRAWEARWFERVDGGGGCGGGGEEEIWRLKTGRNGYWEERERGEWSDVLEDLFTV